MLFNRPDYDKRIKDSEGLIPDDEPVFLLRGQDKLAPRLLLQWAAELRLSGGDPAMAESAEAHAQRMISWQKSHRCKTPDMYQDSYERVHLRDKIKKLLDIITGQVGVILIGDLVKLFNQYYDTINPPIVLLSEEDLLETSKDKPYEILTKMDFNPDKVMVTGIKVFVFVDKRLQSIVIENNFV